MWIKFSSIKVRLTKMKCEKNVRVKVVWFWGFFPTFTISFPSSSWSKRRKNFLIDAIKFLRNRNMDAKKPHSSTFYLNMGKNSKQNQHVKPRKEQIALNSEKNGLSEIYHDYIKEKECTRLMQSNLICIQRNTQPNLTWTIWIKLSINQTGNSFKWKGYGFDIIRRQIFLGNVSCLNI